MLLTFRMKKSVLDLTSIVKKIGADGLYYYEIENVSGIKLGEDIDG